ncbi:MAG: type III-B CRISPR-associated protein Cas10/Cmr2 [Halothece sp.]
MSEGYWQAKLWGLLHDPILKSLHNNQSGRGENSFWRDLPPMREWHENGWNPEDSGKTIFNHIRLADFISSASDRAAIGSLTSSVNYQQQGLEITHLLSGKSHRFQLKDQQHQDILNNRRQFLQGKEQAIQDLIPNNILQESAASLENTKRLYWWLWRCLPEATSHILGDDQIAILPAETRLPDSSIWSHASLTSALAGALAGYDLTTEDIAKNWSSDQTLSHPFLSVFSFSPIQELIKASRKMRDFFAGSWLLHYLSAKVSWELARQYGPDCLLYPSLYQQPLIDLWLLQEYPEFRDWVKPPRDRALLTGGFPNVIVVILPKDRVAAAMEMAKKTLIETWRNLGEETLDYLQNKRHWQRKLRFHSPTWQGWLQGQWQVYWSAVPIGKEDQPLKNAAIPEERDEELNHWLEAQNEAYGVNNKPHQRLFQEKELNFLRTAYQHREEKWGRKFIVIPNKKQQFNSSGSILLPSSSQDGCTTEINWNDYSINVGSWWAYIFDQTRLALAVTKNARSWEIPTAFGPRSTISGMGPVVHPTRINDWITEGESQHYWRRQAGLFDGREELNATETVKRTLEKILPNLLGIEADTISGSYPDLTAGVAGYLKTHSHEHQANFDRACEAILNQFPWAQTVIDRMANKWGIPYIDEDVSTQYHPRLLNAGWLVEDAETLELTQLEADQDQEDDPMIAQEIATEINQLKTQYRQQIEQIINRYYPSNNPANWYVLAAGDGDGMSKWLKGQKMKSYGEYVASDLKVSEEVKDAYNQFLAETKRMGPSTHNALSRALLDFSNQLVPYLTEQRYAGRLIYSGGDDVLAYSNLWEWNRWLWEIRECFRGADDPKGEFVSEGDYWRYQGTIPTDKEGNPLLANRPLFTMGHTATVSFGVILTHHSVPLAIALENLWEAESEAKAHIDGNGNEKDAVQVRVLYGNGNILKATGKFAVFNCWQGLLEDYPTVESSFYEQAATLWQQHPIPYADAIPAWVTLLISRRDEFKQNETLRDSFQQSFTGFIETLWKHHPEASLEEAVTNWLKMAAFKARSRNIKLPKEAK